VSFGRIHSHHRDRGRHGSVGSVIVPVAVGSGAGLGLCVVAASLGVAGSGPGGIVVGTGAGVLSGVAAVVTGVVVVRRQARRVVEAVQAAAAGASGTGAASRAPELGAGGRLGTEAVGGVESGADRDLRAETTAGAFGVFAPVAEVVDQVVATLKAEHGFRSVLDTFDGLVIILDEHGLVTYVGDTVREVLGWRPEEVRGTAFAGYVHTADLERFLDFSDATLARGDGPEERLRLRLRGADGSWQVVDWAAARLPGEGLGSLVLSGRDVTHQVAVEQELAHQANHDLLTGLPNRKALLQLAEQQVSAASRHRPVSVIMIDLDRFKDVNDSLGHAVGDQLLAQVGPRLRAILRPSDTIARLGGDEFAVLAIDIAEGKAAALARRLREKLQARNERPETAYPISFSVGITRYNPDRPCSIQELLTSADQRMYQEKTSKKRVGAAA
jgi:diguanylate cyclase (GGDEF)-like protein/PAS domain S-box-containing protein